MEFPQFGKNLTFKKLQLMAKVLSTLLSPYLVVDNLTLNKVKSKSWNKLLNKFLASPTSPPPPKTMLPETSHHFATPGRFSIFDWYYSSQPKKWSTRPAIIWEMTISSELRHTLIPNCNANFFHCQTFKSVLDVYVHNKYHVWLLKSFKFKIQSRNEAYIP